MRTLFHEIVYILRSYFIGPLYFILAWQVLSNNAKSSEPGATPSKRRGLTLQDLGPSLLLIAISLPILLAILYLLASLWNWILGLSVQWGAVPSDTRYDAVMYLYMGLLWYRQKISIPRVISFFAIVIAIPISATFFAGELKLINGLGVDKPALKLDELALSYSLSFWFLVYSFSGWLIRQFRRLGPKKVFVTYIFPSSLLSLIVIQAAFPDVLKVAGGIAGIGGLAIGGAFYIFKDVVRKNIFPKLVPNEAYKLIRLIVVLSFAIAALGIFSYTYSTYLEKTKPASVSPPLNK